MFATLLPAAITGTPTGGQIFLSEFLGTAVLLTLGAGVVATNLLPKSKGRGTGWLMVNFGWGFAVFAGVYVAYFRLVTALDAKWVIPPAAGMFVSITGALPE